MDTSRSGQGAANAKRIETWEQLRERLFRLAELGDELATVVAGPTTTWLYREIEIDAATVAEIAGAYVDECERADRLPLGGGDRPAWLGARSMRTTGAALYAVWSPRRRGELEVDARRGGAVMTGVELFLGGVTALAVLSLVVKARAGLKRARVAAEITRAGTSPESLLGRVLMTAGVIVRAQWLVISYAASNTTLLLVILAVPALFAAYTLTRALTVMQLGPAPRHGGGRR